MQAHSKGLRSGTLSQWETIGQSLANIAPTATPAMGIPFIIAISGAGSWLACLLALLAMACIAHQINLFARRSSSSGSLYSFVDESLGSRTSLVCAWALLIAYVGTACAVLGGLTVYVYSLLGAHSVVKIATTCVIVTVAALVAGYLAFRDVHVSARVMLVIEAVSIALIMALFVLPGPRTALHWDAAQWTLAGVTAKQVRGGLVLAIFGFVGFESAASLGDEAANPLQSIPRAITLTAWISGLFFVLAAYAEVIGFAGYGNQLALSGAPLELLAELRKLPMLGPVITATTVCSFFACALACITAAARILFKLSQDGHMHKACTRAHQHHRTPHVAIAIVTALTLAIALAMTALRVVPFDVYGWSGTFATYGFITAYFLVSLGSIVLMHRTRTFSVLSCISLAGSFVILAMTGASMFDSSDGVYHWLPYIYMGLLLLALPAVLLKPNKGAGGELLEVDLSAE